MPEWSFCHSNCHINSYTWCISKRICKSLIGIIIKRRKRKYYVNNKKRNYYFDEKYDRHEFVNWLLSLLTFHAQKYWQQLIPSSWIFFLITNFSYKLILNIKRKFTCKICNILFKNNSSFHITHIVGKFVGVWLSSTGTLHCKMVKQMEN